MTHDELIGALKKATGPDRELDAAIDCLVKFKDLRPARPDDFDGRYGYSPGNIKVKDGFLQADRYTARIDAALTLVPAYIDGRNVFPQISKVKADRWDCHLGAPGPAAQGVIASAATPALAICIAALRARGGSHG